MTKNENRSPFKKTSARERRAIIAYLKSGNVPLHPNTAALLDIHSMLDAFLKRDKVRKIHEKKRVTEISTSTDGRFRA